MIVPYAYRIIISSHNPRLLFLHSPFLFRISNLLSYFPHQPTSHLSHLTVALCVGQSPEVRLRGQLLVAEVFSQLLLLDSVVQQGVDVAFRGICLCWGGMALTSTILVLLMLPLSPQKPPFILHNPDCLTICYHSHPLVFH